MIRVSLNGWLPSHPWLKLDPNEDLLFVQVVQEQPLKNCGKDGQDQCLSVTQQGRKAVREDTGYDLKVHETRRQVDGQRVHADDDQKERPFLKAENVDGPVETAE